VAKSTISEDLKDIVRLSNNVEIDRGPDTLGRKKSSGAHDLKDICTQGTNVDTFRRNPFWAGQPT
jgi:hypothetical protein